ncbi:MAG: hypothetical protein AAF682_21125 [Planctomycetota bacterium]
MRTNLRPHVLLAALLALLAGCVSSKTDGAQDGVEAQLLEKTREGARELLKAAQASGGSATRWVAVVPVEVAGERAPNRQLEQRAETEIFQAAVRARGLRPIQRDAVARAAIKAAVEHPSDMHSPAVRGTLVQALRAGGHDPRYLVLGVLQSSWVQGEGGEAHLQYSVELTLLSSDGRQLGRYSTTVDDDAARGDKPPVDGGKGGNQSATPSSR